MNPFSVIHGIDDGVTADEWSIPFGTIGDAQRFVNRWMTFEIDLGVLFDYFGSDETGDDRIYRSTMVRVGGVTHSFIIVGPEGA